MSKRIDFDKLEEAVQNGAIRFREADEYDDDLLGYDDIDDGEMEDGTRYVDDEEDYFADSYATRDDEDDYEDYYRLSRLQRGGDIAPELVESTGEIEGVAGSDKVGEYFSDLDSNKAFNREDTSYLDY